MVLCMCYASIKKLFLVDGGVGLGNIDQCWKAGANSIVAGSAIIKSSDWTQTISDLKEKCST